MRGRLRYWWTVAADVFNACLLTTGFLFALWIGFGIQPIVPLWAQMLDGKTSMQEGYPLAEFAIRQGGFAVVLLVVLFYYRRDYRYLNDDRTKRDEILARLVEEAVRAETDMTAAIRESNLVMHQAKTIMREVLPKRRETDQP